MAKAKTKAKKAKAFSVPKSENLIPKEIREALAKRKVKQADLALVAKVYVVGKSEGYVIEVPAQRGDKSNWFILRTPYSVSDVCSKADALDGVANGKSFKGRVCK